MEGFCARKPKKTILRDSIGEPDPWEESLRIGFVFVFLFFLVFGGFLCIIGDVSVSFPFVRFFGIF